MQPPPPAGGGAGDDGLAEFQGLDPYQALRVLGQGSFGTVVLAQHTRLPDRPLVAIKLIARGPTVRSARLKSVAREILHHGSLFHPHVVGLYEVFLSPRHLCIVMEYAAGGDLFRHAVARPGHRLPEPAARRLFEQLVAALDYMHVRMVSHRDLKLENLLLDGTPDGVGAPPPGAPPPAPGGDDAVTLKVCDFGYSKSDLNSSAHTLAGTPVYMAPEVVMGQASSYDAKAADIFSAGVVLYTLLAGAYPYVRAPDEKPHHVTRRVVAGAWAPFPPELGLSAEAADLVARMLQPRVDERIALPDIAAHAWMGPGFAARAAAVNGACLRRDVAHAGVLERASAAVLDMLTAAGEPGGPGEPRRAFRFPVGLERLYAGRAG